MKKPPRLAPARLGTTARLLGGTLAALLWAGSATAQPNPDLTLIEDTFTADNGTALEGRAPDTTHLPGGTWARANTYWGCSIQGNSFQMGPDNGWTVPLASTGTYARPSKLRISADLEVHNMDNGSGNGGGVGLGFNSIAGGGSNPHGNVTALRLDQGGALVFRRGEGGGLGDLASVAWSGPAFDPNQFYHLSYQVDTVSGNISNIQVTGGAGASTADYSSLVTAAAGYFKGDLVTYTYMWGNSGSGGATGFIDNFKVERVGDALAPTITLSSPADGTKWAAGAPIIASASAVDGIIGPLTVTFSMRSGSTGPFTPVGTAFTAPPYQVSLGALANGVYEVKAEVSDSASTPNTGSALSTITVQDGTGLINIDFNSLAGPTPTYSGAAALGSAGDQWNGLALPDGWSINNNAYSFTTISDSNGANLPGVSVNLDAGHSQCFDPWGPNSNGSGFNNLTQDYIAYDPRFTLSGLAPGNYDFYLYGTRGTYAPVSVNGGTPKTFNGLSGNDTPTLVEGRDYLWFPVQVGNDGKLEFHATDLGGDGWAYRIAGFQLKTVPANTPPTGVTLTRTTDARQYSTESSITAGVDFYYGTPPFAVTYWMRPGTTGDFTEVAGGVLGTLSVGSYQVKAKVVDSSTGVGAPFTVESSVNTISVALPAIGVDKYYTFNGGAEEELVAGYYNGSEPPVYSEGQVILPSGTRLKGTGLFSRSPVNCGLEIIMTQPGESSANRFVVSTGPAFQMYWEGQNRQAGRDDYWGEFAQTSGVTANTEYRLAMVVTQSPGDTTVLQSFYINGVFKGSRSEPRDAGPLNTTMNDLWVGGWNWNDGMTGDGTPLVIKVNEVRVFHFAPDMFSPSLLLTGPTGGVTPPASTYADWASSKGIAGQPADGDYDHDGVANAVEMVLGGDPKIVMDAGLMPTLALVTNPGGSVPNGDYLEFTYRRTALSVSAGVTAECQYNSDLGAVWATAQDGVGGVKVLVTSNYAPYGTATDRVQVYVPRIGHTLLFGRLHVSVP